MGIRRELEARSFDQTLVRWILRFAGNPNISVRLWNGDEFQIADGNPVACMEIHDRGVLFELMRSPSIGFGECYSQGRIEIDGNFRAFMVELTAGVTKRRRRSHYGPKLRSLIHAARVNSLALSRHNVHHHYDLGNDFYKLWLDDRMVYTCAYFEDSEKTLEEAQVSKLDHVCRKLQLQPGQKVVEAGCGWGALAMHMAEHYGVDVIAYNNSHEQVRYARERAAAAGLERQVTFVEDDYRTISERCDVFVSVGMLEHVGLANYRTLGALIDRCLAPDGIGLIHSIGRSHPAPPDKWILKRIFPGGHVPSLGEMAAIFEPYQFTVLDIENLRPHYAKTCAAWLENYDRVADRVVDMYDETFARMWRLYLAGSSAAFETGTMQLYQVVFAPQDNNSLPMTRAHQYPGSH
ncbi:MAG: methyltransferase domain-containing protein [Woeseiaceae bacterium]|nr:methyltransferase domain-containing protein [Woeseiaceae bacterium]NIP21354.1 methyltransferase domain-containing protein [Woeseiaceae bacterium]NIS90321.1 methyltransferase domain-containing protein [Woeseiaceae bacterium]